MVTLTEREKTVLRLFADDLTNHELADKMFISVRTLEGILSKLYKKTGCKSRVGLTVYAIRNGYYQVHNPQDLLLCV